MLVKKVVAETVREAAPPAVITGASFIGITFHDWVYILTAIYTLIQIFRLFPKVFACAVCFLKNRSCTLACKNVMEE